MCYTKVSFMGINFFQVFKKLLLDLEVVNDRGESSRVYIV